MAPSAPEADTKPFGAETAPPDGWTLAAFLLASLIAGANAVAVRVGLAELPPFWGAAIRFITAAAIFLAAALVMGRTLPRGRALVGAALYGLLNFGLTYMFLYWALQEATAGTVMVAFAVAPLLTLAIATARGLERFSYRGLAGAVVAGVGIVLVFLERMDSVSLSSMGAILGAALAAATTPIVVKSFPKVDMVVANGIGMTVGGLLLLVLSKISAEPWILPTTLPVQLSLVYLILIGSIGLFLLFLFVLGRWTASASTYVLLLAPLAAVVLDILVLGDAPSPLLILGGVAAIAGVYIGTVLRPQPRPKPAT